MNIEPIAPPAGVIPNPPPAPSSQPTLAQADLPVKSLEINIQPVSSESNG